MKKPKRLTERQRRAYLVDLVRSKKAHDKFQASVAKPGTLAGLLADSKFAHFRAGIRYARGRWSK